MIDIAGVLRAVPDLGKFCSVDQLHGLVENLRKGAKNFRIELVGSSANGLPIHHVTLGKGSLKALFVAFPHCNEPIGGLTVFSLMRLLSLGIRELLDADVEWHIVPCIDPDGAILNEGWSRKEFRLLDYLRYFHKQEPRDQVELSFPIDYKRLAFNSPVNEAKILQRLLGEIKPDFYYSLHNSWTGGAYFLLTRDIDRKYHEQLHELLRRHRVPIQPAPAFRGGCAQFDDGILELGSTRKTYDLLEATTAHPEEIINYGACSWEYLEEVNPRALTFLAELSYVRHSRDGSKLDTGESLRRLKLRIDADTKYVAGRIATEWDAVQGELNRKSPFYTKIFNGFISVKDRLPEGLPALPYKTRDVLFNSTYDGTMTEGERFNEHMLSFYALCNAHEFVRLLEDSNQTAAVRQARLNMESVFRDLLADIEKAVDFTAFETIDCNTLARVQLGSGLIVLNALLEEKARCEIRA